MHAKNTFPVFMGNLFRTLCYQEKFSAQRDVTCVLMLNKMLEVRPSLLVFFCLANFLMYVAAKLLQFLPVDLIIIFHASPY